MTSPRPARRLVEWFLEPRLADALIGDLDEIFAAEVGRAPLSARLNYCRRAAGATSSVSRIASTFCSTVSPRKIDGSCGR